VVRIRKLVEQDHVSVLAGIILSHIAYRAAPFVDKCKVPLLLPVSAADDLTKRMHSDWVIRTGWSASQASHPFGEWAYKSLGYRRVCIFGLDYPLGYELAGGFQKTFEGEGGKIVQKIWAPLGFADFTEYVKQIRKDADAVYMCTALAAAGTIIKQYRESGPKLPIIAAGPALDENLLPSMGDASLGCVSVLFYSAALDTPANKSFSNAYHNRYGRDTSHLSESSYTTGLWIKKAVEAVHGDVEDRPKFLRALKSVSLTNVPRGPMRLDEYSNPIENFYVRKVERVKGHLQNTVIHTFPNVSQFWTYSPLEFMKEPPYDRDYPPCRYCSEPIQTK
jgi:branched-chain amino acid transport system substrate-binding protein